MRKFNLSIPMPTKDDLSKAVTKVKETGIEARAQMLLREHTALRAQVLDPTTDPTIRQMAQDRMHAIESKLSMP